MTFHLQVPSMACGACAQKITEAIQALDPQAQVAADPKTKLVQVDSQYSLEQIRAVLAAADYPAT